MTELLLHGRRVRTVFDLLGNNENDITYSLGWALSQSDRLLSSLLNDIFPGYHCRNAHEVHLQCYAKDGGYTDIEVVAEDAAIIIEAKRGWNLPNDDQLSKYAPRLANAAQHTAVVAVSECSPEYAARFLPHNVVSVPVVHRSWRQVVGLVAMSMVSGSHAEKRLLRELRDYLGGLMSTQNQSSNLVYVVSLARHADWSSISPVDFVEKQGIYFHPFGVKKGWPKEPPNYVGFRYDGELQSIHHIEDYRVVASLHEAVTEVYPSNGDESAVIIYNLGPAIRPPNRVKTGGINRSSRVWAALDLLLTCSTISEARDKTKKRQPGDDV